MMEELDLLKKDWKKSENSYQQVSEVDLYKMLHRKSSSIVKWILIISILEVLLWTAISIFYNSDEYLIKTHHENLIGYFKYLTIFNYGVIAVFIFFFYKNYKAISTITSTKQLMKDILKTRKTVKYYVGYNLGMIAVSMVIGFVLVFTTDPKMHELSLNGKAILIMTIVCVLTIVISVGIFWLFYRLLYGILLRKLFRNYNELKKIDL
jgi:hypothetical protein